MPRSAPVLHPLCNRSAPALHPLARPLLRPRRRPTHCACAQVYGSNGLASGGGALAKRITDPASRSTPESRDQPDEGEASGGEEPQPALPAVEAPHGADVDAERAAEREGLARRDIAMWAP